MVTIDTDALRTQARDAGGNFPIITSSRLMEIADEIDRLRGAIATEFAEREVAKALSAIEHGTDYRAPSVEEMTARVGAAISDAVSGTGYEAVSLADAGSVADIVGMITGDESGKGGKG